MKGTFRVECKGLPSTTLEARGYADAARKLLAERLPEPSDPVWRGPWRKRRRFRVTVKRHGEPAPRVVTVSIRTTWDLSDATVRMHWRWKRVNRRRVDVGR